MPNSMSQIKHVVYVMLENRSFDNVLGWLYDEENSPKHLISNPKQKDTPFYGLVENKYSNSFEGSTEKHYVKRGASSSDVPAPDPHESYRYVTAQLYGQVAYPPDQQPYKSPPDDTPATNDGFLANYATAHWLWGFGPQISQDQALHIMEGYTPAQLPVLNGLAKNYAVSDYWFSSVPTQTNCNRAFSLCGTSLGWTDNSSGDVFDTRTIWNALQDNGKASQLDWMIYFQEDNLLSKYCYTRDLFPQIPNVQEHVIHIDAFYYAASNGMLPAFSYLEPAWYEGPFKGTGLGRNGNSYHPPGQLGPGEGFVYDVYKALTTTKEAKEAWKHTLLIITFDEHGGTYDHKPPKWGAAPPWGDQDPPFPREYGFKFNRFGVRVPALLISPLIEGGTVFRSLTDTPFDHTSVIATVLKWQGIQKSKWRLGERVAKAPTFDNVLTLPDPRNDIPTVELGEYTTTVTLPENTPINSLQMDMLPRVLRHLSRGVASHEEIEHAVASVRRNAKSLADLQEAIAKFKRIWHVS